MEKLACIQKGIQIQHLVVPYLLNTIFTQQRKKHPVDYTESLETISPAVQSRVIQKEETLRLQQELKRHFDSISNWIRIQKRMVLFIYPISAASEFMLGGVIGSGKSVETFMNKPVVILALFITILILMPAASYTAKWLFKKSFGKHLDDLKENIDSLEEEKK